MTDTNSIPPATPTRNPSGGSTDVPSAVTVVLGALLLVVATLVCDLLNLSLAASLAVFAFTAAASSIRGRLLAAGYVGVMAFALFNAFVEDREGVLDFHGRGDLLRLAVLVLVSPAVAAVTRLAAKTGWV